MKPTRFVGDSRERIADFPEAARQAAGFQLFLVQSGQEPTDWKPLNTAGSGVREIRIRDSRSGQYRVLYVAKFDDAIYVLHAFEKKTQKTPKADIELAADRYAKVVSMLKKSKGAS